MQINYASDVASFAGAENDDYIIVGQFVTILPCGRDLLVAAQTKLGRGRKPGYVH